MLHPQRKWDLIHSELPRHLKEIGVVAGPVDLERWVTEDTSTAPKRNRRILFELLTQNHVNTQTFSNLDTWQAVRDLLTAAAMVEENVECREVETAIGAIALEQQDVDFLARTAFVLGRSYAASHRPAQRVAASTADIICSVIARGATVLSDPRFRNEVLAIKHVAQKQGIGEPVTWRSLQRSLGKSAGSGGPDCIGLPGSDRVGHHVGGRIGRSAPTPVAGPVG